MSEFDTRFGGLARLFSPEGLARLRASHVCVIGIGGVGSWSVEALARSGIGELTLIDLDEICVSNVNRQIHTLDGEIGKSKVEVMARRVQAINPDCTIHVRSEFFTDANAAEILAAPFSYVLDAIDSSSKKAFMIAECGERGIPIITTGAAGGRRDPTQIRVADLTQSSQDRLLRETRTKLRTHHNFPRGEEPFGVPCVYSTEPVAKPSADEIACAAIDSTAARRIDCNTGYGTAGFVTGAFGLVAAGFVVRQLAGG